MKKIILIPDSFKGTMCSTEICEIMKTEIKKHYPTAQIVSIPVADGGEGSVDCFLQAVKGNRIAIRVNNPLFEKTDVVYAMVDGGNTAVIEMAMSAGLSLIEQRKDPLNATTYGVGEMILDAIKKGAKKIIVGLGGSATNDGGCGAACAAGIVFYNQNGEQFVPVGGTLNEISRVDLSERSSLLNDVEIIGMCDVDNPMYGLDGAAYIFGPQKGATPDMVHIIDKGLRNLAEVMRRDLSKDVANIPGAGAAGAMGAGMIAFFNASLLKGIDTILEIVRFDDELIGADMILTGEGKIDNQSLHGKVIIGVAERAKCKNIPVIAFVGDIGDDIDSIYEKGVTAIISINRVAVDIITARFRAKSDLALTVDNFMRFCKSIGLGGT